ncbi:MAG TPA: hypothetical protein VH374_05995 [Polyangia bacterium]|nr:hypothetical protein [Polyangia bacterium]
MDTEAPVDAVRAVAPAEIERLFFCAAVRGIGSLFADYGVTTEPCAFPMAMQPLLPDQFGRVAFIGDGIEGAIVLGASSGPLGRSRPDVNGPDNWIAELTNQLMGRIKNQMLRAGIQLQQALPAVVGAEKLRALSGDLRPWILLATDGVVGVGIEIDVPAPIIPDARLLNWDVPPEGELLLF